MEARCIEEGHVIPQEMTEDEIALPSSVLTLYLIVLRYGGLVGQLQPCRRGFHSEQRALGAAIGGSWKSWV